MGGENVWDLNPHEGGRLAARWWQWAFSAPDECSPVLDETGEFADWQQPEDVWFLAGTYGGRVERRCSVTLGRPIFFPVFNTQRPALFSTRPAVMDVAEATAFLNGTVLPLHEYTSPPFRTGLVRRVAWGLWSGLAPLAQGQYVLEIKASTGDGFWVDTTYHLDVTPS
ncbi:hypothetical protein [Streptomyces kebangsaanensis]|uniref:hypothetical protein n=1 Tax=Streptomyces kebangsaanensis TaxID=864058 RepID=UPI000939F95F|nr:hypothetical protein [Streptomyces kebangsaanensis]